MLSHEKDARVWRRIPAFARGGSIIGTLRAFVVKKYFMRRRRRHVPLVKPRHCEAACEQRCAMERTKQSPDYEMRNSSTKRAAMECSMASRKARKELKDGLDP